ncbi:MAG: DUF4340 domain-containing protein [Spirochaetota bacterium]
MKQRSRLAILAANLVLAATLVSGLIVRSSSRTSTEPLASIDVADVNAVTIGANADVVLERTTDRWEIVTESGRFPARADRVGPFLDELANARVLRTVTERSDVHADLGVDDAEGRLVRIEAGGAESTFIFGAPAQPGDAIHVRRAGSDRVVIADAAVDFYFGQPASFWAYLRVFPESVRPGEIVRLRVEAYVAPDVEAEVPEAYEATVSGQGEEQVWRLRLGSAGDAEQAPASESRIRGLARALADLVGNGFYAGEQWSDLPEAAVLEFDLADGRSFTAQVRASGDEFVVEAAGPALPGEEYGGLRYTIPSATYRRLVPDPASLGASE